MSSVTEREATVVEQVAAHIKDMIVGRGLKRGEPIPSYREIAGNLGVAYTSVKFAMDGLAAQGIVRRQRARGCYVNKELSRAGRSLKKVGIIFPSSRGNLFSSSYLVQIMQGINSDPVAVPDIHIFSLREDGFVSSAQISKHDVDAVVLLEIENDDFLREFLTWNTPGVVVDYCAGGIPLDFVACDNRSAARRVVAHVADLGHRRVAYAAACSQKRVHRADNEQVTLLIRDSSDERERLSETVSALRERGMLVENYIPLEISTEWPIAAADELQRRMRSGDRPTALLTDSNHSAIALLKELARRGLHAPQDISVCAVASDGTPEFEGRSLTCCRVDFAGMGRKAIALLTTRCQQPGLEEPGVHRIGFSFVEGATTGPVGST